MTQLRGSHKPQPRQGVNSESEADWGGPQLSDHCGGSFQKKKKKNAAKNQDLDFVGCKNNHRNWSFIVPHVCVRVFAQTSGVVREKATGGYGFLRLGAVACVVNVISAMANQMRPDFQIHKSSPYIEY